MKNQNLTPGRLVHFFPAPNDTFARMNNAEFVPALVIQAWPGSNNLGNLKVFNCSDEPGKMYMNVKHKSEAAEGEAYWEYQQVPSKEQPKNTDAESLAIYFGISPIREMQIDNIARDIIMKHDKHLLKSVDEISSVFTGNELQYALLVTGGVFNAIGRAMFSSPMSGRFPTALVDIVELITKRR